MSHELPPRRSLESLKKEAKRWLDALRANDPEAHARLARALPDAPAPPTLRDVQHALAREHGFAGWAALKDAVEQRPSIRTQARMHSHGTTKWRTRCSRRIAPARPRRWSATTRTPGIGVRGRPCGRTCSSISVNDRAPGRRRRHHARRCATPRRAGARVRRVDGGWQAIHAVPRRARVSPRSRCGSSLAKDRTTGRRLKRRATGMKSSGFGGHPSAGLSAEGQMTDALLAELSHVDTISALGLSGCRGVTDDGVAHLARLPALRAPRSERHGHHRCGLQVLRELSRLRTISLAWTRVTDAGIGALAHCDDLEQVNLAATAAGDGALRALAGKRKLHHLTIALTDAGLPLLHELPVFKSWQGGEAAWRCSVPG